MATSLEHTLPPGSISPDSNYPNSPRKPLSKTVIDKITTHKGLVGDYDYGFLCLPQIPCFGRRRPSLFYGLNEELPLILAIATGLQHALAMLAGLITPPIIFASSLNLDPVTSAYMISASLIGSGKEFSCLKTVLLNGSGPQESLVCSRYRELKSLEGIILGLV